MMSVHYGYNLFAIQQNIGPSGSSRKFYRMSSELNTITAKEHLISSSLPQPRLFASSKKKRQLLALLLFVLTLLVYDSVSRFQFINYDDPEYVTANVHVHMGLHKSTVGWAFTSLEFYNWHPLTWISYLVDYQLFKLNPAGYHFMNVVYHALGTVLLFLLLQRATGYIGRSFCVAVLFAVHPLNIQSVAWIAERKNVLSTIFWFLAIGAYGWYALRPNWKRYLSLIVCFLLGLMAKGTVITLPCALLLLDVWPLRRVKSFPYAQEEGFQTELNFDRKSWLGLVWEKIPLFLLCAASAFVTFFALHYHGGMARTSYPLDVRIKNAVIAYVLYIPKTFFPYHLAIIYPHPGYNIPAWKFAVCAILLLAITAAVVHLRLRRPYLLVGWFWFLGTLAPVIGVFQYGDWAMADRNVYVPLLGIFVALIWGTTEWVERNHVRKMIVVPVAFVLLAALIADTRHELRYWQDSISLFSHAVSVTEGNARGETNLGVALYSEGRVEEAALHFSKAVRYDSSLPGNHYNYGRTLLLTGKPWEAIEQFNQALQRPSQPVNTYILVRSHYELGLAYMQLGNAQLAEDEWKKAIRIDPSQYDILLQLGLLYQRQNRCQEAITTLTLSLQMRKSNAGLVSLGICLEQQHKLQEARAVFQDTLNIFPGYEPAETRLREVEGLLAGNRNPKILPK